MSSSEGKTRSWIPRYNKTNGSTDHPQNPPTSPGASSPRRRSFSSLLTFGSQDVDQEGTQLILNALERTSSSQPPSIKSPSSFGKMSFSTMMGGLSALSLTRTSTNASTASVNEDRGRSIHKSKGGRSNSHAPTEEDPPSRSQSRTRSMSPFSFRRRRRNPSPTPEAIPLANSDVDLSDSSPSIRPRNAFTDSYDSGDETVGEGDPDTENEDWSDDALDPVTERNTERNVFIEPPSAMLLGEDHDVDIEPDPLGEGVNVVVPPEPYFPSSLITYSGGKSRNPKRRKSTKYPEPLPFQTARPLFQRDRCTITLTQGDPAAYRQHRRPRRYVVASDMSEESRYAVEWGIGTVLRDGDDMLIVTVIENDSKVDPAVPNTADRTTKLRSQQERQGLAYILVRQATSLLQRTKLNVTISCQAWHAKNARHMLLDIVDYTEPIMLIVGSRGLSRLKGILLGSTSHYLIQKCSVPVMVARRRLKRPPKKSAHLAKNRRHVSLAEAGIDRVVHKVDEDVKTLRDEMERDDNRRDEVIETGQRALAEAEEQIDELEDLEDGNSGQKVAG